MGGGERQIDLVADGEAGNGRSTGEEGFSVLVYLHMEGRWLVDLVGVGSVEGSLSRWADLADSRGPLLPYRTGSTGAWKVPSPAGEFIFFLALH